MVSIPGCPVAFLHDADDPGLISFLFLNVLKSKSLFCNDRLLFNATVSEHYGVSSCRHSHTFSSVTRDKRKIEKVRLFLETILVIVNTCQLSNLAVSCGLFSWKADKETSTRFCGVTLHQLEHVSACLCDSSHLCNDGQIVNHKRYLVFLVSGHCLGMPEKTKT